MNFYPSVRAKYIVLGEVNIVFNALRRAKRWATHSYQNDHEDPLITSFDNLKNTLNRCNGLFDLNAITFLSPFLEVIRAEETSGPTTSHALTSLNKFIVYDLIDLKAPNVASAVSSIADAVTHARFVGTDPSHDEVVLTKILQVLRSLILQSIGSLLTNEAVCEIMQSCFRICFETRLSDLLRKTAEHTLVDMIQVLFVRLPKLKDDYKMYSANSMKKLKMRAGGMPEAGARGKRNSKRQARQKKQEVRKTASTNNNNTTTATGASENKPVNNESAAEVENSSVVDAPAADSTAPVSSSTATIASTPDADETGKVADQLNSLTIDTPNTNKLGAEDQPLEQVGEKLESSVDKESVITSSSAAPVVVENVIEHDEGELADSEMSVDKDPVPAHIEELSEAGSIQDSSEPVVSNLTGVLNAAPKRTVDDLTGPLVPYGLPCVRELFRFLISLINPHDANNLDHMNQMGMSLLTVALEVSRDTMAKFPSVLSLIKDDMCRYLFQLLNVDKIGLVASALRVSLLLFESLRKDLKFQLECFLRKLMELISNEQSKFSYELKELALEAIMQLWHIPGFVTELYLNYDCDFYCSNIFDDLSKLLSKNAFPVSGLYPTHLLSLDALLTVVRSIEQRCNQPDQPKSTIPTTEPESTVAAAASSSDCEMSVDDGDGNQSGEDKDEEAKPEEEETSSSTDNLLPDRFSSALPTIEELREIKKKKKILVTGTEQFNQKPKNGIAALQKAGILDVPIDACQVSRWLRDNPWLDKAMIGEYLSDRRFPELLVNFVRTFKFEGLRVDEALRLYLETFRLPGEAPVIEKLITAFSDYWGEQNNHPFKQTATAFILSYAVIMLNTDQHNRNVRKQHKPMSCADFLRNTKCAVGQDYDKAMLEEIYATIKNDEIVLPEEQTGPVRDKWLWNVLIRRGATKEGKWLSAPQSTDGNKLNLYDSDLFAMSWGPTVSALSYVFDKSLDEQIIQRAITGFKKCAMISANFGMSEVFDNLIISLCKFTGLSNTAESAEMIAIIFGQNPKSQLAARAALNLAHRHGDILREGWRNILDIILPLFRSKLLPPQMMEAEDFVNGTVTLLCEEQTLQRPDSFLTNLYQFVTFGGPGDNSAPKQNTPEDQQALEFAQECVKDLQLENLVTESKFLRLDSLQELVKALMVSSRASHMYGTDTRDVTYSEDSAIFYLELLLRVVLQNRDRILSLWQMIRDHLYTIIVMASDYSRMLERAVIGLLRIAIRLLHREDVSDEILASLQILIMIKPAIIPKVSRQIAFGLDILLRENAANIHLRDDWITIFTIMKCVGAGSLPPPILQMSSSDHHLASSAPTTPSADTPEKDLTTDPLDAAAAAEQLQHDRKTQSDSETVDGRSSGVISDRGYTSDSEVYENLNNSAATTEDNQKFHKLSTDPDNSSTIQVIPPPPNPCNQFTLQLGEELHQHDMRAMVKCCETLAFLVRDTVHITPDNFVLCVRCIRTFAEASINGVNRAHHHSVIDQNNRESKLAQDKKKLKKRKERDGKRRASNTNFQSNGGRYATNQNSDDDSSVETVPDRYHTLSLQLLDLMHTLHTKAGEIYQKWAAEEMMKRNEEDCPPHEGKKIEAEASDLWDRCWCPLLQGIARLCCDARRQVRSSALTFLQRALLNHDLHTLTGKEWESCFNKVLFPLLSKLLENISPVDPDGMEETRMRGATLLSKVFLQHLTPLLNLPTFTALWLTILDFMDKYMHIGKRDLLFEAIPESLKNMLLVMHTARIFHSSETVSGHTSLWDVTWERINDFLPNLKSEVVKAPSHQEPKKQQELVAPAVPEVISRDTTLQTMPAPGPFPVTPIVSDVAPVAGVIPAISPKLTPPTSLQQQAVAPSSLKPHTNVLTSPQGLRTQLPTNILMNPQPPSFIVRPVMASPTSPTQQPILQTPAAPLSVPPTVVAPAFQLQTPAAASQPTTNQQNSSVVLNMPE